MLSQTIDVEAVRRRFSSLAGGFAFLDAPGGSQVPDEVGDAIALALREASANLGAVYATSLRVKEILEQAEQNASAFLGCDRHEVVFGPNMTSLNFTLSRTAGREFAPGDEILVSSLDHDGGVAPWLELAHDRELVVRHIELRDDTSLDFDDLASKLSERTRVVAFAWASNAVGTITDAQRVCSMAHSVGALAWVDAVHYAPHFPIDVAAMDADFLLCSGYKFYGPHVGVLYSKPGALDRLPTDRLSVQDPAAPYRIETGTLNHAAIDGMRAAVDYLASWGTGGTLRERIVDAMHGISAYEHHLARSYHDEVRRLPGVRVWGPDFTSRARAPTVSITLEGHTAGAAATALGARGVCVWDGNFYAARAVDVLGLAERGGLLRTGVSMYTTQRDISRLLEGLATLA